MTTLPISWDLADKRHYATFLHPAIVTYAEQPLLSHKSYIHLQWPPGKCMLCLLVRVAGVSTATTQTSVCLFLCTHQHTAGGLMWWLTSLSLHLLSVVCYWPTCWVLRWVIIQKLDEIIKVMCFRKCTLGTLLFNCTMIKPLYPWNNAT